MSEFITRSSSNRVHFNDKKSIFSNPQKQINLILIIFLSILLILSLYYLYKNQIDNKGVVVQKETLIVTTPTPGILSPARQFQVVRDNSQLQILDLNSNLLFKLYDKALINYPEKWLNDSVFIYKNEQQYGFIVNNKNVFSADPELVSDSSCSNYLISPDNKKIIFFQSKNGVFCSGTLIDFSNLSKIDISKVVSKNNNSLENAFWDSDSKSLNTVIKDEKGQSQTKIIPIN